MFFVDVKPGTSISDTAPQISLPGQGMDATTVAAIAAAAAKGGPAGRAMAITAAVSKLNTQCFGYAMKAISYIIFQKYNISGESNF